MSYPIFWSDEAIRNLETILSYLSTKWTEKEASSFKARLAEQLSIISKFPTVFPVSPSVPRLRKAVLTKQTIIFYEFRDQHIYIAYLFESRQNPDKVS
ncbi:type II toxin-antitoxin system RelE/ParE family toxin [Pontibacter fetidus]|uniref:Type II toxin-antitoxin system RelE/ParE family toxin n=1 Tax=Pontibacter fetidus TaxID=2700082 RepID=A0A6B2GYB1_9BACT|nr:type II toxin-antitoxin system RelE/ParE family toxin [Pontibacter fetidus]NDK55845.1 type II toxin-antitoxin system RelE/ParE family toxin [Pontibacter fetidus]